MASSIADDGTQPSAKAAPASGEPFAAERRFAIVESAETPTARTPDGCVSLELHRSWHSLRYRRGPSPDCPHFEQSVGVLREMLQAFAAYGDLGGVTSFDVDRDYAAFYTRLAIAAARSGDWDRARGTAREGSPNAAVVALASDPSFFPEVTQLFASVGLVPELRGVEKVRVGTPEETPFAAALAQANVPARAKLPFDCILAFHLTPKR